MTELHDLTTFGVPAIALAFVGILFLVHQLQAKPRSAKAAAPSAAEPMSRRSVAPAGE